MPTLAWARRLAPILLVALGAALAPTPTLADSLGVVLPLNTWVRQPPPAQILLPGHSGIYEGRGWGHLRYDSNSRAMVLYDGYIEPPSYPNTNIYSNSIWRYEVATNRLILERLSNWTRKNGSTIPLPANQTDPTPFDRHPYSCLIVSASKNRAYLWAGANNSISTSWVGNTWTYDFSSRTWREVSGTSPYTVFEQSCSYDPYLETIVLFGGARAGYGDGFRTCLFDLDTETWTELELSPTPSPRFAQTMCFDPVRRITWMFGGGYGQGTNELWSFDAAARSWRQVSTGPSWPSPRRFAHMAYDTHHDIILMWGGLTNQDASINETWAFDPATETWQQLFPDHVPTGTLRYYAEDMDYDPENNVFVLNLGGAFWLYRYQEIIPPPPPRPSAPTSFVVTTPTSGQAHLSWIDTANDETGYELERSTGDSLAPFTLLASLGADAESYDDLNLDGGAAYCYRVRAVRGSERSDDAGPICVTTPPPIPASLDFAGQAYVDLGDSAALGSGGFTLECWLRRDGDGTTLSTGAGGIQDAVPLITRGVLRTDGSAHTLNYFLGIRVSDGVLCADFVDDGADSAGGSNHPVAGATPIGAGWHHAAATYDGSMWKLYLDGWIERTLSGTGQPGVAGTQSTAIAAALDSTRAPIGSFDGAIDEVRIWNHARSAESIQDDANVQLATAATGLIGRWSLDEGTGPFINGSAGTTIAGTLIGTDVTWGPAAPFDLNFEPPMAPASLVAQAANATQIELTWNDRSSDESDFQIERSSTGPEGSYATIGTAAADDTSYSDQGLTASTEYCYRVAALNRNGTSPSTEPACATTSPATGYILTIVTDPAGSGSVARDPDAPDYFPGTEVQLTASPDSGWAFRSWAGDISGIEPSVTVTMSRSKGGLAIFNEVGAPAVSVAAPAGGELLTIGAPTEIRWSATGEEGAIRIDILLARSGWTGPYDTLGLDVDNTGSFSWTVTEPPTSNAFVKIVARAPLEPGLERVGWDLCDQAFTIAEVAMTGVDATASPEYGMRVLSANPGRDGIRIELDLPRAAPVRVDVWDVAGRLVANLAAEHWSAGRHWLRWTGRTTRALASSGIYFVRFSSAHHVATRKIVLLR